jgi:hypothetical protein
MLKRLYPRWRLKAALGIGPAGPPSDKKPISYLYLRYPVRFRPRYTLERPHKRFKAMLEARREIFAQELKAIVSIADSLRSIPAYEKVVGQLCWDNVWLPRLDAAALYARLVRNNPKLYLEVGSGYSTGFARRAIRDHNLRTKIVSIDPHPRADIDSLCDQIIRCPVEETDLAIFRRLESGDILFIDSSHSSYQNSDVSVLMMEVLPELTGGVHVHFHDIYWPYDYPANSLAQFNNEQYLVGAHLLAGSGSDIILANQFIARDADLVKGVTSIWGNTDKVDGTSMWLVSPGGQKQLSRD